MIRYSLIIVLCVLLAISSYLLYKDQYIVINIQHGSKIISRDIVQGGETENYRYQDSVAAGPSPKVTLKPDISTEIEVLKEDSNVEVQLDPSLGVDINPDRRIQSSYRVIGPKEFVLLTEDEKPMVEINLETGNVTVSPDYNLDDVSTEFWKSIGKKYPEVCFVEDINQNQAE